MQEAISKNPFRVEGGVVHIFLTKGKETTVDLSDWGKVSVYRWWALKNHNTFYAQGIVNGKRIGLHNFILGSREQHDHKDGNGLNNTRSNLRPATNTQNGVNRRKETTRKTSSSFKGVSWVVRDGIWRVYLCMKFIGDFEDEVEAARAYDKKAKELFGEFARLNFPETPA